MISCLSPLPPGRDCISSPIWFQILAWLQPVSNLRSNRIFVNIAVISYIRLVTEDLSFRSQYTAGREINKIKESSLNLNLKFLKNWFSVRLNHTNTCKIITLICSCKQKKKKKKGNYLNCARVGKTESGNMLIKLGKEDSGHF